MRPIRIAPALAIGALTFGLLAPAGAQEARQKAPAPERGAGKPDGFASRDELHRHYDRQYHELDRRRIADLARLAQRQEGEEAEATYQELFNLAIARDLYDAADQAAEAYLAGGKGSPSLRPVATLVQVIADSSRGDYDQALRGLEAFLKGSKADKPLEPSTIYAVGEAFLQRLINAGRYDMARKVCDLFIQGGSDQAVKAHFTARLDRIDRLGKPAPPIGGSDVDGKTVSLADLKGKVVLVDFWATWCPPCVAEMPELKALQARYGDKGFQILGVNLDAVREDIREIEKATPVVRHFLVNYRIPWPNLLVGHGASELKAYGVTEIPANFLIDREGKIIHVELSGPGLEKAVAEAVGGEKTSESRQ